MYTEQLYELQEGQYVSEDIVWKDVVGYEGLYEVNNYGIVKSLGRVVFDSIGRTRHFPGKIMKTYIAKNGYKKLRLTDEFGYGNEHTLHRIVAEAFIPNPENKEFVNHIDGDKTNNNVNNLEWSTCGENNAHAYDEGLRSDNKEVIQLTENNEFVAIHKSLRNAADNVFNGLKRNEIWSMCIGKRDKPINGYKFIYAQDYNFDGIIFFAKVHPKAKIPSRSYPSAGYDVYACFDEDYVIIPSHTTVMIPSGIASAFSPDFVVILKERGSTGTKGMAQRSGVVDADYRGQWFVPINNTNDKDIVIAKDNIQLPLRYKDNNAIVYPYRKAICQALILQVPNQQVKEIVYGELQKFETERGMGALGSSGK